MLAILQVTASQSPHLFVSCQKKKKFGCFVCPFPRASVSIQQSVATSTWCTNCLTFILLTWNSRARRSKGDNSLAEARSRNASLLLFFFLVKSIWREPPSVADYYTDFSNSSPFPVTSAVDTVARLQTGRRRISSLCTCFR